MICPSCKKAGHFSAEAKRLEDPRLVKNAKRNAKAWHKKCSGDGCTCQHKVDHIVNTGIGDQALMRGNSGG